MNETTSRDLLMKNILRSMVSDARVSTGLPQFGKDILQALDRNDIVALRGIEAPCFFKAPIYIAKITHQVYNFCKRYVFDHDLFSADELESNSLSSFKDGQKDVAVALPNSESIHCVLKEARKICTSLLGVFDKEELTDQCHFGRNAAVGLKKTDAYLDVRFATLTGSYRQHQWFREFARDHNGVFPKYKITKEDVVNRLTATAVPKSYKTYRIITLNTVIGGLHSAGIGDMISDRLCNVGINFSYQQDIHRSLCMTASIDRRLVTLDLSKASDNIGFVHLRRLLPSSWMREIQRCRIRNIGIGEDVFSATTFMSMGIGLTFPLQTLVFYSLIKAICNLTETTGHVSVFGDDCIFPTRIYKYVQKIFMDLGFIINMDKTFHDISFRESCGVDVYRGVDIRPYMPQSSGSNGESETFEQFVYKVYNGLFGKWHALELPRVHHLLMTTLACFRGTIFQVPLDYPESSGIRVRDVQEPCVEIPWSPVTFNSKKYNDSLGGYNTFYCFKSVLESSPTKREVLQIFPYIWETLRTNSRRVSIPVTCGWCPNTSGHGVLLESVLRNFFNQKTTLYSSPEQCITYITEKINTKLICQKIRHLAKSERKTGIVSAERQNLLALLRKEGRIIPTVPSRGHSVQQAGPRECKASFWITNMSQGTTY